MTKRGTAINETFAFQRLSSKVHFNFAVPQIQWPSRGKIHICTYIFFKKYIHSSGLGHHRQSLILYGSWATCLRENWKWCNKESLSWHSWDGRGWNIAMCCCRTRIGRFNSGSKGSDCREEEEIPWCGGEAMPRKNAGFNPEWITKDVQWLKKISVASSLFCPNLFLLLATEKCS